MKYEYKKVRIKTESQLRKMGKKGWQLTAACKGKFYFMRELTDEFTTATSAPETPAWAKPSEPEQRLPHYLREKDV